MLAATLLSELRESTTLVIAVLIFIVLLVYRRPLGEALNRLSHLTFKRGETEVTASANDTEHPADQAASEQSPEDTQTSTKLLGDADNGGDDGQPGDPASLRSKMVSLLFERREEEAKNALAKLQEAEPDPRLRKVDRMRWEAVRFMTGLADPSALDTLRRMAEDEEIKAITLLFIGHCMAKVGQLSDATDAYLESAAAATAEPDRAEATSLAATTQAKAGHSQDAISRLKDAIRQTTDEEALFSLWTGLASVYKQRDDHELRAIALQKATELQPNNSSIRFEAAWSFSEASPTLAPLVAHHYDALLGVSPDYGIAINNFGVQLERLEMPIHAVGLYESAAEKGNTLAMANLAYQFMGAGFAAQANAMLEKAANLAEPHENVASATASLAKRREEEKGKKTQLLNTGQQLAEFIRTYAVGLVDNSFSIQNGTNWAWDDGRQVELTKIEDEKLKVTWDVGTTEYELIADIHGRTARGRVSKKAEKDYRMSKQAEAFVLLAPSGDSMQIARLDSDGVSVLVLRGEAVSSNT